MKLSLTSETYQGSFGKKKRKLEINKQHKDADDRPDSEEMMATGKSESAFVVTGAHKGEDLGHLDSQKGKWQKMDASKMKQCATILKKLMTHQAGWVFNLPVDPVILNIPDYFSIISKPMDLGTIKHKLESNRYLGTHQFAADVRLTFSNAMRYNPPGNDVHIMAKELNNIFHLRWESLDAKWRKESSINLQQSLIRKPGKQTVTSRQVDQKMPMYNSKPRRSLASAEKLKLRKSLVKMSMDSMPPRLLNFLQKACVFGKNQGKTELDIDMLDEESLWELHQILRCMEAGPMEFAVVNKSSSQVSVQHSCKGNAGGNRLKNGCIKDKAITGPSVCMNGTYGSMGHNSRRHYDLTQDSSSDVDSERSSGRESHARCSVASDLDCKKKTAGAKGGNNYPDSDGAASVMDEENDNPHPATPAAAFRKGEDDPLYEEPLSPTKALRAVILKSRFADTILKAQHKTLLKDGEIVDPAKMKREREKLEKKQKEEKARIEVQVKAAEAAARMKVEAELRKQREREREAARLALQKMEKTVDIDENFQILKDLELLGYSQPAHHFDSPDEMVVNFIDGIELQAGLRNPLEQLGLFMKNDDLDEEADEWISAAGNGDVEEGEIGPT